MRLDLVKAGLKPDRFASLGPTGLNWRFDLTFGLWPGTAVLPIGNPHKSSAP
jgi:hypothetical protein